MEAFEIRTLTEVFEAAAQHHDPNDPAQHDLDALANHAMSTGGGALGFLRRLIRDPEAVLGILALLSRLGGRDAVQKPPAVEVPPPPKPQRPAEPALPPPPSAPSIPELKLETWLEEGWHDWRKGPDNDDGHFDARGEAEAGKVLPPGPVLRFMTGIADPSGGPASVPQDAPEGTPFPDLTWHYAYNTGERYSFSTKENGSRQPASGLGHIQFGPKWRDSRGWDHIIRLDSFGGDGPRTLRVWTEGPNGATSNLVDVVIARE